MLDSTERKRESGYPLTLSLSLCTGTGSKLPHDFQAKTIDGGMSHGEITYQNDTFFVDIRQCGDGNPGGTSFGKREACCGES